MKLRPYQAETIAAVDAFLASSTENGAIILPTGAGKSVVMAALIQRYMQAYPGTRIIVLAHVQELVRQNAEKLLQVWREAPLGIYSAGLGRRDLGRAVLFAGIGSVYQRAPELGRWDLVFVDEAHRIPERGEGKYRTFLAGARAINPALRVLGFTATPFRLGPGLVVGPDYLLREVAHEVKLRPLIRDGYLSTLTSKATEARADLSGVHLSRGDYKRGELEDAMMAGSLVERTAEEIARRCADRRSWIVFCAGVEHSGAMAKALAALGISAESLTGATPKDERADIIARHGRGELRCICNVNVLSEGYDAPHIDAVILLRPTKSAGLYYQQVGRGLRLSPGKTSCLVLDFAGNIAEHGPVDAITAEYRRPRGPGEKGEAPTKTCPHCLEIVPAGMATCPDCGAELAIPREPHSDVPDDAPILSQGPQRVPVDSVSYHRHEKRGGVPSLRVEYRCGLVTYREWVFIEHPFGTYPNRRARGWWSERDRLWLELGRDVFQPESVDEALALLDKYPIREPSAIWVDVSKKYPEIVSYEWMEQSADGGVARGADAGRDGPASSDELHRPEQGAVLDLPAFRAQREQMRASRRGSAD